ncbi:MAG: dTMP kinase [Pseudonocardiaceae bacterium]
MINCTERLAGLLVTIDGPGGVGKSTALDLVVQKISSMALPILGTTQPSRTPLGELIRRGTDTYRGMALGCLVAGDRHHQLATEIGPALRAGTIVVSDRYLPSSLVLQRIDGLPTTTVWQLNAGAYVPDLAVILNADPDVINARLRSRGGHSRFERDPDSSRVESVLYRAAATELHAHGWPVLGVECTQSTPEEISDTVTTQIMNLRERRSAACPS